jgi:hypothetical protein
MTPKEKAEALVDKYKPFVYPYVGSSYLTGDEYPEQILNYAKLCALITVDEIINTASPVYDSFWPMNTKDYWKEVKEEIEKL